MRGEMREKNDTEYDNNDMGERKRKEGRERERQGHYMIVTVTSRLVLTQSHLTIIK